MDLTIRVKPAGANPPKVIPVVGKATFKRAVDRNLLKRRLRAILLPLARSRKAVVTVVARGRGEELSFAEIKRRAMTAVK